MKGKTGWEDDQACNKGNKGVQETDIDAFSKQRTIFSNIATKDCKCADSQTQGEERLSHSSENCIP